MSLLSAGSISLDSTFTALFCLKEWEFFLFLKCHYLYQEVALNEYKRRPFKDHTHLFIRDSGDPGPGCARFGCLLCFLRAYTAQAGPQRRQVFSRVLYTITFNTIITHVLMERDIQRYKDLSAPCSNKKNGGPDPVYGIDLLSF
jgi:hypothetical protein